MNHIVEFLLSRTTALTFAIIIIIVYAIPFSKNDNSRDFAGAFTIFISIAAIHSGLKVILIAYVTEKLQVKGVGEVDLNYLIIGAIATIWFSFIEIWKKLNLNLLLANSTYKIA